MERKEVEVLSEASNYAVIRMPGRHFPGYVVQGDSLSHFMQPRPFNRSARGWAWATKS